MTLLYLVAAWTAGMFVASRAGGATGFWVLLAGVAMLAAVILRSSRRDRLALACLCVFALGAARYGHSQRPLAINPIAHYVGRGAVTLVGTVNAPPESRDTHINLRVSAEQIIVGETTRSVSGLVLVQVPLHHRAAYRYGDRLVIEGPLFLPPTYEDFSYRDYLARRGIHTLLPVESVDTLDHGGGRVWLRAIYALRERAVATVGRLLPSPQGPLLTGILLGDESSIPADTREAFNLTGAAHVIAISGANIAILLRVLMSLLEPLAGRTRSVLYASGAVIAYAILVGGDAAVTRATVMGIVALLGAQLHRRTSGLTLLAFSVWLLSVLQPNVLWDIGFQLSVAATAGLVLFTDDLTGLLSRGLQRIFPESTAIRLVGWLSEPLVVSLAAQIATTPLILYYFGRLSLASLITNLLIVSIQPYIMIAGWVALTAGLVSLGVGEALAWVVWLPLTFMVNVVEALARLPWASANLRLSADAVWLICAYLLAFGLSRIMHPEDRSALWQKMKRSLPAYSAGVAGIIVALLIWQIALRQPDGRLHVWFLDVGDGNAALIETPRGAQILIDGGRSPTRLRAALGRALPFQDRELDAVILTSDDAGAVSALPAVFDRYKTRAVLLGGGTTDEAEFAELVSQIAPDVQPTSLQVGHAVVTDDGVRIEVLGPYAAEAAALRISYGAASLLLGFRFSAQEELALLQSGYYPGSTVLQLAQGGHQRANTPRFLAAVDPQVAIAAVEAGNRSGLPHPAVIEHLKQGGRTQVYRTDRDGTVEVITDGAVLEVHKGR